MWFWLQMFICTSVASNKTKIPVSNTIISILNHITHHALAPCGSKTIYKKNRHVSIQRSHRAEPHTMQPPTPYSCLAEYSDHLHSQVQSLYSRQKFNFKFKTAEARKDAGKPLACILYSCTSDPTNATHLFKQKTEERIKMWSCVDTEGLYTLVQNLSPHQTLLHYTGIVACLPTTGSSKTHLSATVIISCS